MAGYAIYDGYYLSSQTTSVAHAGHLGGTVFGILYYLAKLRGLRL
jgi:membrane associated rhomboid family serine protease